MRRYFIPMTLIALAACDMPVPDMRPSAPVAAAPAAVEAPAPANPVSAKERFVAAAEANGCELNSNNVTTVMTEARLTAGDLQNIVLALVAEGRAVAADDSTFRITTPACTTA